MFFRPKVMPIPIWHMQCQERAVWNVKLVSDVRCGQISDGVCFFWSGSAVDGKEVGNLQSALLCRSLFDLYIGDDPFDKHGKESIGLGLASLLGSNWYQKLNWLWGKSLHLYSHNSSSIFTELQAELEMNIKTLMFASWDCHWQSSQLSDGDLTLYKFCRKTKWAQRCSSGLIVQNFEGT